MRVDCAPGGRNVNQKQNDLSGWQNCHADRMSKSGHAKKTPETMEYHMKYNHESINEDSERTHIYTKRHDMDL